MTTYVLVIALSLVLGPAPQQDLLAQARQAYNAQKYDDAISAAVQARKVPAQADAASVVLARAYLDRYEKSQDKLDLDRARDAMKTVNATKLTPRDRVELFIGLGQSSYIDQQFLAAADLFELAMAHSESPDVAARDRLFEWWANSLHQHAQGAPAADRKPIYARILHGAQDELKRDELSAVASYWLVAGARGTDDVEWAWGAAMAAWMRAPLIGPRAAMLREDLDDLVLHALIPERAIHASVGDAHVAVTQMTADWEDFKKKWK